MSFIHVLDYGLQPARKNQHYYQSSKIDITRPTKQRKAPVKRESNFGISHEIRTEKGAEHRDSTEQASKRIEDSEPEIPHWTQPTTRRHPFDFGVKTQSPS